MLCAAGGILRAMATREITRADVGYKGTQLKLLLELKGGQKVVFKPKRSVTLFILFYIINILYKKSMKLCVFFYEKHIKVKCNII